MSATIHAAPFVNFFGSKDKQFPTFTALLILFDPLADGGSVAVGLVPQFHTVETSRNRRSN